MKRMLIAVAALGLAASASRADWGGPGGSPAGSAPAVQMPQVGGPNTLLGMGDPYNGAAPDRYGLHPRIKRLFRIGPAKVPPSYYYPMMGYPAGPAYNPMGYPPGAYGPAREHSCSPITHLSAVRGITS